MSRIDTHSHVIPKVWRKYCNELGHGKPDGMPAIPAWSEEAHIACMDKAGISKSILSITSPGTHLKASQHELAAQITRETNEEMAEISRKNPDRFGFFAALPLPDVEGSIKEIDYALDVLGATGVGLMTNAYGVYLGDAVLDPVFAKLNSRKAIVFMHPTQCHALDSPEGDKPLAQYPTPMLEFFFDTTRAVVNLLLSGTVTRYPDITFLVSHCGACLPTLVERSVSFGANVLGKAKSITGPEVKELFRTRFYFDLAGTPFPDQIHGYLRIGDASRLLYGSDFPYTPDGSVQRLRGIMDEGLKELFNEEQIDNILSGNARKLLGL